jgi:hypothetical protein
MEVMGRKLFPVREHFGLGKDSIPPYSSALTVRGAFVVKYSDDLVRPDRFPSTAHN